MSSSHHVTFYIHHLLHHTNANLRGGKYQRRRALIIFWGKERERGEGVQFSGTKRGRRAFYIPRQRGILCCQERDFSKNREEEMWDDDDGSCMIIRTRERGVNVPPSPRVVGGGGGGEDGGGRNLVYLFSTILALSRFLVVVVIFPSVSFCFASGRFLGGGGGRKESERASEFRAFGPLAISIPCFLSVAYFLMSMRLGRRRQPQEIEEQKWAGMPDPGCGEERQRRRHQRRWFGVEDGWGTLGGGGGGGYNAASRHLVL